MHAHIGTYYNYIAYLIKQVGIIVCDINEQFKKIHVDKKSEIINFFMQYLPTKLHSDYLVQKRHLTASRETGWW